jgi:hypothetical protein
MEWQFIVALVIALPIILFPVALIWYLNVGGLVAMVRDARKRHARQQENSVVAERTAP